MQIVNSNIKSNKSSNHQQSSKDKEFNEYVLNINADDTPLDVIQLSYIQTHTNESLTNIEDDNINYTIIDQKQNVKLDEQINTKYNNQIYKTLEASKE